MAKIIYSHVVFHVQYTRYLMENENASFSLTSKLDVRRRSEFYGVRGGVIHLVRTQEGGMLKRIQGSKMRKFT